MAASLRAPSSAECKPTRQRHGGHERQAIESGRRWSRRGSKTERHRDQSARRSPPRQFQQRPSQLPTPMSTPNTSTPSLHATLEPRSFAMERTPSGHSIISDNTYEPNHNHTLICSDEEAAGQVKAHMSRLPRNGNYELSARILRGLIQSKERIDNVALDNILTTANSIFFNGELSGRVLWDWSHPEQHRYQNELIGTTALRHAAKGGYETLIVLSNPLLNDNPSYDRRLIISVFLHELIHCYLFIRCGFEARLEGGHTDGFHEIAALIDNWVGEGHNLKLCNMKANLNHFRSDVQVPILEPRTEYRHPHDGCNRSPRHESDYLDHISMYTSGWN